MASSAATSVYPRASFDGRHHIYAITNTPARFRFALLASTIVSVLTLSAPATPCGRASGDEAARGEPLPDSHASTPWSSAAAAATTTRLQSKLLMDSISKVLPVDWTVAIQGGRGTTGKQPLLENPDWAKGFDIVVHNQCFADIDRRGA